MIFLPAYLVHRTKAHCTLPVTGTHLKRTNSSMKAKDAARETMYRWRRGGRIRYSPQPQPHPHAIHHAAKA